MSHLLKLFEDDILSGASCHFLNKPLVADGGPDQREPPGLGLGSCRNTLSALQLLDGSSLPSPVAEQFHIYLAPPSTLRP